MAQDFAKHGFLESDEHEKNRSSGPSMPKLRVPEVMFGEGYHFPLPVWWFFTGLGAAGVLAFLIRGKDRVLLEVRSDGAIFVSINGSKPAYAH